MSMKTGRLIDAEILLRRLYRHLKRSDAFYAKEDRDVIEEYFERTQFEDRIQQAQAVVNGRRHPPVFSTEHPSDELLRERAASLLAVE